MYLDVNYFQFELARKFEQIEVEWAIFHYMNKSSNEALHVI